MFDEIQNLIQSKTGKSLLLLYGGLHTCRISYDINMLFKSTSVGIDITIEHIDGTDIYISYSGGMAIEMMMKTALARVKDQPGADMLELVEGNGLIFHLGRNPQLAQIFERAELRDIFFDEQSTIIEFAPKMI